MISCPAAKEIRWVKPSITTVSPSRTWAATASCMLRTLEATGDAPPVTRRDAAGAHVRSRERAQPLVDHPERGVDVLRSRYQRRREPERAASGAQQQQAARERLLDQAVDQVRRRLAGGAVLHELDPDHEAASADVADARVARRQGLRTSHQP